MCLGHRAMTSLPKLPLGFARVNKALAFVPCHGPCGMAPLILLSCHCKDKRERSEKGPFAVKTVGRTTSAVVKDLVL